MAEKGIANMKSRPGGPCGARVPRKAEDTIFMYPVSHSMNLEAHSITVRFAKPGVHGLHCQWSDGISAEVLTVHVITLRELVKRSSYVAQRFCGMHSV